MTQPVHGPVHGQALEKRALMTWEKVMQSVAAGARPWNVHPGEAAAVEQALVALEADLEHPATTADRMRLGVLAGALLLRWRLQRVVFGKGLRSKAGELTPALAEWRQVSKLILETLREFRFRAGSKPTITIGDLWRQDAAQTTQDTNPDPTTQPEPACAATGGVEKPNARAATPASSGP